MNLETVDGLEILSSTPTEVGKIFCIFFSDLNIFSDNSEAEFIFCILLRLFVISVSAGLAENYDTIESLNIFL